MQLWQFPTKIAQKPWLHFFTIFATKTQKLGQTTKLGEAKTQPRSIPFATKLFTPHFAYICDNSPPRLLKNHDFTFSPILLPSHKKPIHPTWLSQNPTKIYSFCNQTFHTSFCIHLWQFPTKIAQKPLLHLFTNFATKAQKANPRTWLSQNPTNINSFCNQTFHTSFCIQLWQFLFPSVDQGRLRAWLVLTSYGTFVPLRMWISEKKWTKGRPRGCLHSDDQVS